MVKDPVKLCFQHKIMKNTVLDKTLLSQPRFDAKRSFDKKWLILNKTQFLAENNEKHSLGVETSFYSYTWCKMHFLQEMVDFLAKHRFQHQIV